MKIDPRHPLFNPPRPLIWVPPMDGLGAAINAGIEFNRHGLIVIGLGRIGKTDALTMLANTTHWRDYATIMELLFPGESRLPTEGYFYSQLSLALDLKVREQSLPTFMIDHVANHLCEKASRVGARIIILGVDDANRLRMDDYNHLVTLDNRVSARGCRLFVLLVIQQDADQSSIPVSGPMPHPSQITGRFTADTYPYTGLRDSVEIAAAFKNFVNQTWNGRSFLQDFAPTMHANQWEPTEMAGTFVDQVATLRGQHDLEPYSPFPMLCFDSSSYYMFGRLAAENPRLEGFTPDQLRNAIEVSGLIELELSRKPKGCR